MSTLYRKYRPQLFKDVIGQNHIRITLQNELETDQLGHAYLFCGPRGLGKTTSARLFAKAVNCENRKAGDSEPCNQCSSCLEIIAGNSMDTIEIDAASNTGVDNVRENIIENSRFTPVKSKRKIFIIDEVHMMTTAAFNALLKTLEEPPAHVIFILCTTEVHKIPQTILSRCQRFDFKKVSLENMIRRLEFLSKEENKQIDELVLKNISIHSEGCVRDAESLLGKIMTLGDKISAEQAEIILPRSDFGQITALLEFIVEKNTTAGIELINHLVEDGVDLQIFTDNLLEFLRKIMLIKAGGRLNDFGIELDESSQKSAERLAEKMSYNKLVALVELFLAKKQALKNAFIQQFPLEMAVVEAIEDLSVAEKKDNNLPTIGASGSSIVLNTKSVQQNNESLKSKVEEKITPVDQLKEKKLEIISDQPIVELVKEKILEVDLPLVESKVVAGDIDLKKVEENWLLIIEKLLVRNYTLSSLLRISRPLGVHGNMIEIGVKSNFYCDRLRDSSSKIAVEETISEIIGTEVNIKTVCKPDVEPLIVQEITHKKAEPAPQMPTVPIAPKDIVQDVMGMF
ncbi:MAG: DNA polymerase III subunit gamma/tau [bacterium]